MHPSRRGFLATTGVALTGGMLAPHFTAQAAAADPPAVRDPHLAPYQPLPEPKIVLPTDALGPPTGRPKRIAAITTAYWKYSHADDIITKFIEGYSIVGRTHLPHCKVVSLYIDQFPDSDIGRGLAARYRIPLYKTAAETLTAGKDKLNVDGVLLVGEHGDYPLNEKGQKLYPRRELFEQCVNVFRAAGRAVPVYNDKHFSYSWENAAWMYRQSRELGFPMMAGSSVPVTWRKPPVSLRLGVPLTGALAARSGHPEVYGFHVLETLQTFVERRPGGETGVKAVEALQGDAAWDAAAAGHWDVKLLDAAVATIPEMKRPANLDEWRKADPKALVYRVEYRDGFVGIAYVSQQAVREFCFAGTIQGRERPVATFLPLLTPQRDHFSFLCNHIEVMFRSGKPSYPVERTYLVTGILAAAMDSLAAGKRIATPHLEQVGYQPVPELS